MSEHPETKESDPDLMTLLINAAVETRTKEAIKEIRQEFNYELEMYKRIAGFAAIVLTAGGAMAAFFGYRTILVDVGAKARVQLEDIVKLRVEDLVKAQLTDDRLKSLVTSKSVAQLLPQIRDRLTVDVLANYARINHPYKLESQQFDGRFLHTDNGQHVVGSPNPDPGNWVIRPSN